MKKNKDNLKKIKPQVNIENVLSLIEISEFYI